TARLAPTLVEIWISVGSCSSLGNRVFPIKSQQLLRRKQLNGLLVRELRVQPEMLFQKSVKRRPGRRTIIMLPVRKMHVRHMVFRSKKMVDALKVGELELWHGLRPIRAIRNDQQRPRRDHRCDLRIVGGV